MGEDMGKLLKEKQLYIVLLIILTVLQVGNIIYCFTVKKVGYHSDELFTYAYSNNNGVHDLAHEDRDSEVLTNNNQWLSGKIINSYLSVDTDDRFDYMSIIKNNKGVHPPMYFILLHTICSFFPEQFSLWYGFIINLVCFVVCQILIFSFVKKITDNYIVALMTCVLYGFSQAAVNTYIFVRMYALVAVWCVLSLNLHYDLMTREEKFKRIIPVLSVVTLLGALTHYHFLVYAGILSFCFCVFYLFKKEIKKMFIYGISQLLPVAVFVLIHPNVLGASKTMSKVTNAAHTSFDFELKFLVSCCIKEIFGFYKNIRPSYFGIHLLEILLLASIFVIPCVIVFRNEKWMKKFGFLIKNIFIKILDYIKKINCYWIFITAVLLGFVFVVAKTSAITAMGVWCTRYVFPVYPIFFILFVNILYNFIVILLNVIKYVFNKKKNKIVKIINIMFITIVCVISLYGRLNATEVYYFNDEYEVDIISLEELPRHANYIAVLKEFWLLNYLTKPLRDVENVFVSCGEDIFECKDSLQSLDSTAPVYILIPVPEYSQLCENGEYSLDVNGEMTEEFNRVYNIDDEMVKKYVKQFSDFFEGLSITEEFEYIGVTSIFNRLHFAYCIRN